MAEHPLESIYEVKLLYKITTRELYQQLVNAPDRDQAYINLHYCFNDQHQRSKVEEFPYHEAFILLFQDDHGIIYGLVTLTLSEEYNFTEEDEGDTFVPTAFLQTPTFPNELVINIGSRFYDGDLHFQLQPQNCILNDEPLWSFNTEEPIRFDLTEIELE